GVRTAFFRLGIPALILGLAEAVHQFVRLADRVGGIGPALNVVWTQVRIWGLEATQWTVDAFVGMANTIAGTAVGIKDGFAATFGLLPSILGEIMITAVNGIIASAEWMLNQA